MPSLIKRKFAPSFSYNDIPMPVIVYKKTDGVIIEYNTSAKKIFGSLITKGKNINDLRLTSLSVKKDTRSKLTDLGLALHRVQNGSVLSLRVLRKVIKVNGKECYVDFLKETQQESTIVKDSLIATSLDAIISVDTDGYIIEWNPAAERIFGWKKAEVIGENMSSLIIPEKYREQHLRGMNRYRETGSGKILNRLIEISALNKEGDEFFVELTVVPIRENNVEVIYSFIRNIAERKRTEQELKQSEFYLKRAQSVASVGSWEMSGRFQETYWSDEFYRIHGLAPQSIKPSTRLRLAMVYPKDRARLEEAIDRAFREGKPYSIEKRIILPNKDIRWILSQGEATIDSVTGKKKVFGTLLDITERKRAEEQQLAVKKRLQQTLRFSRMGTAELTIATGMLTVDEELFLLLEEDDTTSRSLPLGDFLEKYILQEDVAYILNVVKEGTATPQLEERDLLLEFQMKTAKGNILYIYAQATFRSDGTALGILRDITQRRNAESESKTKGKLIETMLYGITDGFFATDRELNFNLVSPVFANMAKMTPEVMIGKNMLELFPFMKGNELHGIYEEAIRTGKATMLVQESGITPEQFFEINVYPNAQGLFIYYRDVSQAKKAEQALIQNWESYKNIFEANPLPMWIFDKETLEFLEVNDTAVMRYGYSKEEFYAMKINDIKTAEDQSQLHHSLKLNVGQYINIGDTRHKLKTGEVIDVTIFSHGIFYKGRDCRFIVAIDITARLKAEMELRQSEERFRSISQNIPRGAIYQFIMTADGNYSFPFMTDGIYSMLGVRAIDIISDKEQLMQLAHPDDRVMIKQQVAESALTLSEFHNTSRFKDTSGNYRWITAHSKPNRLADGSTLWDGVLLDETEKKKAEETMEKANELFSTVTIATNDTIWDWNLLTDELWWNSNYYTSFGYTPQQTTTVSSWTDGVHPEDRHRALEGINQALREGKKNWTDEYRYLKQDGTVVFVHDRGFIMRDRSGMPYRMIGSMQDISERKRGEEEILKMSRLYEVTSNINQTVMHATNKEKLLAEACSIAVTQGKFRMAWVGKIDPETKNIKPIITDGFIDNYFEVIPPISSLDNPAGQEPTSQAYRGSKTIFNNNISNTEDQSYSLRRTEALNRNYQSSIALPILINGKAETILTLYSSSVHFFTEKEVKLLEEVTANVAFGIAALENSKDKQEKENALIESEERFRTLVRDINIGIIVQGPKAEVMLTNQAALDLLGLTEDQLVGKTSYDKHWNVIREDGSAFPGSEHPVPQAILTKKPVRGVVLGFFRPTIHDRVWLLLNATPRLDEQGNVKNVICTFNDITQLKEAQKSLQFTRFTIDHSSDPIFWIRPDASVADLNPAAHESLGYTYEEMLFMTVPDFDANYNSQIWPMHWRELKEKRSMTFASRQRRKDGTEVDVEINANFIVFDNQEFNCAFVRDITERKKIENDLLASNFEKDSLIKEIHHRVKNNLQLISSILYIKANSLKQSEIKNFLNDTRQKIRSIALIHERLLQTETVNELDIADYLSKLILDLQMTNIRKDLKLNFESNIEPEIINLDTAIYCGLIINELITNSMKHAFTNRSQGTINVILKKEAGKHVLIISDNGSSLPAEIVPGQTGSFGMQLLDVFVKQLNGKLEIDRTGGTAFIISFK